MITCHAEEFVPITVGLQEPYGNIREKARAACNAAKLLQDEGYDGEDANSKDFEFSLKTLVTDMAAGKEVTAARIDPLIQTPSGAIEVNAVLTAFDMAVVQDAKRIRNYVTNKLILESENMDARIRIKALEMLGKISDVGLFSERTEVTINNRSTLELETTLKDKLRRLMGTDTAEDVQINPVPVVDPAKIDVDKALGDL